MTINLEKSLLKESRKLATPKELLLIKEYETHTELLVNDALSRVGVNETIKKGKRIKEAIDSRKEETNNFEQERVFHISQIKAICEKYYLMFLNAQYYKGVIDKDLPTKITNFEAAYGVKCTSSNIKICAPLESFEQEEPKASLMFYQINEDYYYLIHKWGNDLVITRRFCALLANGWFCWLVIPFVFTPLFFFNVKVGISACLISFVISTAIQVICQITEDEPMRFIRSNKWDSPYYLCVTKN